MTEQLTDQTEDQLDEQGSMTIIEHLTELRNRIGVIFAVFIVFFIAAFIRPFGSDSANIADLVYRFLQSAFGRYSARAWRPDDFFTGLHEGFFTQVKVAFFTSLCITFPLMLIQI